MLIKACLNGSPAPGAYPALPLTPAQLALEARRAVAAGQARSISTPRGRRGRDPRRRACRCLDHSRAASLPRCTHRHQHE